MYRENASSQVFVEKSRSYIRSSLRQNAFQNLLDRIDPPLTKIIKTGDRVLVKPYLRHGNTSDYKGRLVSHPNVVADGSGCCKGLRSESGARRRGYEKAAQRENIGPDEQWMCDLAKSSGVRLVSFTKAGAQLVRGNLHFPREYLISRAVLEVDAVVNCANFQSHGVIGFSGAVKNMLNAVVGECQGHLFEIFPYPEDLARVIVDVCKVVKPTISFLDLTTVRDPINNGIFQPVGLLLAGYDPVALDAVAVHAVGHDKAIMSTNNLGEKHGLGCADLKRIKLSGLDLGLSYRQCVLTQVMIAEMRGVRISMIRPTRLINKTVLASPKPNN